MAAKQGKFSTVDHILNDQDVETVQVECIDKARAILVRVILNQTGSLDPFLSGLFVSGLPQPR